jgi:hypothetical protein
MGEERGWWEWEPTMPLTIPWCPKPPNGFVSNGLKKSITEPRFCMRREVAAL